MPSRPPRRKPARRTAPAAAPVTVTAGALGARGDVQAENAGQKLYVPFALPGETVEVRPGAPRGDGRAAELVRVMTPSAERVAPPCPHFGTCGGCALQHMAPAAEAAWKRDLVVTALARRGLDVPVAATVSIAPGTRRRATLGTRRTKGGVILGFKERQSHTLIDVTACPVLRPELQALLPALRRALAAVVPAGAAGDAQVQWTDSGADLRLDLPAAPDLAGREALAALAEALDLARFHIRVDGLAEPVAVRRPPLVHFGGVAVNLPPGAFLQPSAEGEHALRDLVLAGLDGVEGAVADLFCGLGTFALPLAERHAVFAADGDGPAVGALAATGRVRTAVRDLFADPLAGKDLAPFSAVVFDPPRAGAREQAEALAAAGPAVVVAVSCAPATFARDARALVDGGYVLENVTPVDQFAWSAHVELVAVFRRPCS
ncbi:class I SAM-dependent RNA methyltransferase [Novispirillum sp. DQ9]|uniref:class I SAM-dependent RNA methyltransferase n=1 Tax=Novispirillum sp. DQ9 TaxID=3398612 RepID=UPI003C7990D5